MQNNYLNYLFVEAIGLTKVVYRTNDIIYYFIGKTYELQRKWNVLEPSVLNKKLFYLIKMHKNSMKLLYYYVLLCHVMFNIYLIKSALYLPIYIVF